MIDYRDIFTHTPHETLEITPQGLRLDSLNFGANPAIESLEAHYPMMIAQDTWDYIAMSAQFSPEKLYDITTPTLEDKRNAYNAFCQRLRQNTTGVISQDDLWGQIPIRRYTPSCASAHDASAQTVEILFFHGGGFIVGDLDSHDHICATLCQRTEQVITAVDYRLAPEHRFPAAFEDCLAAYQTLCRRHQGDIVLCGDSAGGTLAAGISAYCALHHLPMPRAQILIYPYLGGDPQGGSYQQHRNAPLMTTQDMLGYSQCYHGEYLPLDDIRALPILADSTTLPATICLVYAVDPLADDGVQYCRRLEAAGVQQHLYTSAGLPHGTFRAFEHIAAVAQSWDWLIDTYQHLLTKQSSKKTE